MFNDNILFGGRPWLERFAEGYRERVGLPFQANFRPDLASEEAVRLLRSAGCRRVCLGVECGDEEIANRVLRRGLRNAEIRTAFRRLQEAGVETVSYNILGAPFETGETLLRTIRLNAELRPTGMYSFLLYPFPGTESYEICREHGFLTDRRGLHNSDVVMIRQPTVSEDEVLFAQRFFRRLVHLYRAVRRLPPSIARPVERALDRILLSKRLPRRRLVALRAAWVRGRRVARGIRSSLRRHPVLPPPRAPSRRAYLPAAGPGLDSGASRPI